MWRCMICPSKNHQKSICLPLTILEYPTICHSECHYLPFWNMVHLAAINGHSECHFNYRNPEWFCSFCSPVGPQVSRVCPIASPIGVGQHLWSRARRLDRCFLSSWACCIPYMMQYIYIYMHYNIIYIENYIDIFWLCAHTHMYIHTYIYIYTYDYIWLHMYIYICIHM
jgi:hypothetical protein